ncbi:hypothetical protein JCM16303_002035 [Sporobolomyces ruberrimus]
MDSAPVPNVAFAGTACFGCFKPSPSLKKCSSCRIVKYCSQECSVKDWKDHKPFCLSLKAIRSTVTPPQPFSHSSSSSSSSEIKKRRAIQRKVWLTEDELLELALKRQATMLESKLLWREPRCIVCWDRECDVEKRKDGFEGWKVCKGCRVVGFCGKEHEEVAKRTHLEVFDAEGRSQCEAIKLSNEIDEFFLRRHLSSSNSDSSPSLWVPNRLLSSPLPQIPSSWSSYLSSVASFLPSPTPPLAEIHGVFLESLSPVLTILSALHRLDYSLVAEKLTLYLLDESLESCSNWIPCLEELQHQLPSLSHLELITVSPLPSSSTSSTNDQQKEKKKTTQLSSLTKLPMCPKCTERGRTRTITHLESLPSTLSKNSFVVSFNSSIALSDPISNPGTFWARTLESLSGAGEGGGGGNGKGVGFLLTSQTREEAKDTIVALKGVVREEKGLKEVWTGEENVWKGGWGRVEGWWGLKGKEGEEEYEGEGIVWKNGWWSAFKTV